MTEYDSSLRTGLIAINLDERRRARAGGPDHRRRTTSSWSSRNGRRSASPRATCGPMGRATAGVRGMKLKNADDAVVGCDVVRRRRGDAVRELERPRQAHEARPVPPPGSWRAGRAGHEGHRGPGWRRRRRSRSATTTRSSCSPRAATSSACRRQEISVQGRDATGVRVARARRRRDRRGRRPGARGATTGEDT